MSAIVNDVVNVVAHSSYSGAIWYALKVFGAAILVLIIFVLFMSTVRK